jgi:alpha-L-fucosidase
VARIEAFGTDAGHLDRPLQSVDLLGHPGEVEWRQGPDSLEVVLPETPPSAVGAVIRVTPVPANENRRLPFGHQL